MRQNSPEFEDSTLTTSTIRITIDLEFEEFDDSKQRWLKYGLAAFLETKPEAVQIRSVEKGSVLVTVELRTKDARRVLDAHTANDPRLREFLSPLIVRNVSHISDVVPPYPRTEDPSPAVDFDVEGSYTAVPDPDPYLTVTLRRTDRALWASLRAKFLARINNLLDATFDRERDTTARDEMTAFTTAMLDYAKAKLKKSGIETEQLAAEISTTYAEKQKELARTEKTSEEARQLRLQNDVAELRVTLAATKAMLIGDEGEEAILFGKQLDTFLEVLREIAGGAVP